MVAAIGTGSGQVPAQRALVSEVPRLPVRAIPKIGRSVDLTWPQTPAHALHTRLTRIGAGEILIETGSTEVEVALAEWPMPTVRGRQRGIKLRMICPRCETNRDALHFFGEWGCRGCFSLSYPCRHRQRYCSSIARRARLRRKLARVPRRSLKARALKKMIAREQRAMLAHLRRVNNDLDKRSRRDARHRRATERT